MLTDQMQKHYFRYIGIIFLKVSSIRIFKNLKLFYVIDLFSHTLAKIPVVCTYIHGTYYRIQQRATTDGATDNVF